MRRRRNARIEARLTALGPSDEVVICPIVRGEILYGIARLPQGQRRENLTRQATSLFAITRIGSLFHPHYAARRYSWCRPPSTGISTTTPAAFGDAGTRLGTC
jgi:hypothetical protein